MQHNVKCISPEMWYTFYKKPVWRAALSQSRLELEAWIVHQPPPFIFCWLAQDFVPLSS